MYFMDASDEEIVIKIQHGQTDLFNTITERYFDRIFRYTLKMHFGNIQEAEDSTAETFYKAYRFINSYSLAIPFSAWLYRVAKNTVIDSLRKHKRQPKVSLESYLEMNDEPIHSQVRTIPNEKMLIDTFLEYVNEEERSMLTLHYLEGVPIRELSDLYKLKENTITVKIKRAKEKIRKLAEEKGITYYE
jgi:RNA polymerase sigma-70 factor (ECF subfamily)